MRTYKQKSTFDILNDISEHVNLVQLIDSLGNLNNDISVVGYWIFYLKNEKALVLNRESLDTICAPSVGKEQVDNSETLFYDLIYIHMTSQLRNE